MIRQLRPIEQAPAPAKTAPQPQPQWPIGTPPQKGPVDAKRRW